MFEVPNAKRVRRDELSSPASSPPPSSPALSAQDGVERLGKLLGFETFIPPVQDAEPDTTLNSTNQDAKEDEEEQEQEFEFRLFSAPAKRATDDGTNAAGTGDSNLIDGGNDAAGAATQKLRIRLRSPTPVPGDGKFVVPFRGWQYYVTAPELLSERPSAEWSEQAALKRKEYEDVAVTGAQLFDWAKSAWPGCQLPWRIIHLDPLKTKLPKPSSDPTVYIVNQQPVSKTPKSRKRPGKKRRIVLRKRAAASQAAKEAEAEKRNRRNREKKIKRRQRERERKAALAAAAAGEGGAPTNVGADKEGDSSEVDRDD
ncbi:hypothetical protein VTN00DRAFT_5032 [Thermoascus crustaceus]|uniref:uncharacterized protein n=1 Tax=Thermoascus crustaceus TaxID=5088 RepID=UPI003743E32C